MKKFEAIVEIYAYMVVNLFNRYIDVFIRDVCKVKF